MSEEDKEEEVPQPIIKEKNKHQKNKSISNLINVGKKLEEISPKPDLSNTLARPRLRSISSKDDLTDEYRLEAFRPSTKGTP